MKTKTRKPPKPWRRYRISVEEFARVWNTAADPQAAAAELGVPLTRASSRAAYLRSCGVDVKQFRRGAKLKPDSLAAGAHAPAGRAATFAAVWNAAATIADAARQLKLRPRSASTTAAAYRRRGLELKRFERFPESVSATAFVAAWNESSSVDEVAARLGRSPAYARTRAQKLRYQGAELKQHAKRADPRIAERVRQFVAIWNAADSTAAAAAAAGMKWQAACNRASQLRKKGFKLKLFPRGAPRR